MEADLKQFAPPLLVIVGDEDDWCLDGSVFLKRTVPTAGLLVIPRSGHTITSEEPADVQRGARRALCRRRSRPLAGAQTNKIISGRNRDGPQAQGQDRAGHRRQRRHRQGHRPPAGQGRRRCRDLRAAQGAARSDRERDRQGDRAQDRRHSRRSAQGRRRQELHRAGPSRRSAASTSWSTMPARRRAASSSI